MTRLRALVLGLGLFALLGTTPLTVAGQEAGSIDTVLQFNETKPARNAGWLALSTTLTRVDGQPINNEPVVFFQEVSFYGDRQAALGSATTDSTGEAILLYQPAENGLQHITAYFHGDEEKGLKVAEARAEVQVQSATTPYHREPPPLALVREWLPVILVGLVLATWTALLGTFLKTIQGVRRAVLTPSLPGPAPTQAPVRSGTSEGWEVSHQAISAMERSPAATSTKSFSEKGDHV